MSIQIACFKKGPKSSLERVLNSLLALSKSARHEIDHAEVDHGFARFGGPFIVLTVALVASHLGEHAFDDPAFGQDDKSIHRDRWQYRPQHPAEGFADPLGQTIAAMRRIRTQHPKSAEPGPQPDQGQSRSILILPVGSVNNDSAHQSQGIDDQEPLASGTLSPRIVAPCFPSRGCANRLAVDNRSGWRTLLACGATNTLSEGIMKTLPRSRRHHIRLPVGESASPADVDEIKLPPLASVRGVDADPAFVAAEARVSVDSPFAFVRQRRREVAQVDAVVLLDVE